MKDDQLQELAGLYGLEAAYWDGLGIHRTPPQETLTAALRGLGVSLESPSDLTEALRLRRRDLATRRLQPVLVHWIGESRDFVLTLPARNLPDRLELTLHLESGEEISSTIQLASAHQLEVSDWEGDRYERRQVVLPDEIPPGYHRLVLGGPGFVEEALLISAPARTWRGDSQPVWGLFAPFYYLRTDEDWGVAGFTEFARFADWVLDAGARLVGTLPILATFLEEPFAPSPYSPVSRLFWNELFIDPALTAEWDAVGKARELAASTEFQRLLLSLRSQPLVDYRRAAALQRQVLEVLADHCFETSGPAGTPDDHPELEDYARFRAAGEQLGLPWTRWPETERLGNLESFGPENPSYRYHAYCQREADRQLKQLLKGVRSRGAGLYLDLPLGVHPDGFDVWRHPESFADGVSGGAPPDGFFTDGQDWGFRPLHPERARAAGYAYFRSVLSRLMEHSDLIRIDHAMSLQRLFWVPVGAEASEGVYVHYPTEELFAVVVLESHRNRCVVVGEDLGTVTPEVRSQMERRGILRMYVGQFEFSLDQRPPFRHVPGKFVASLNTHDTPTAAGFWHGDDVEVRFELGLLDREGTDRELWGRGEVRAALAAALELDPEDEDSDLQSAVLRGWLRHLASSEAEYVLVGLDDLLGERVPHNVPGTIDEKPNWRKRCALTLEQLRQDPRIAEILADLDRCRKRAR